MPEHVALLAAAVLLIAFLYSSVGHAGASGYIAVMSLWGLAPGVIKPTALTLNILVACIGAWQFWRAGHFSWQLFWPFALLSVPFAFLGGYLNLPTHVFKILVGIILLFSALRFMAKPSADEVRNPPPRGVALGVGAGLGLMSGLTGTGGGIFLTPLMLLMKWAKTKNTAAVSALFILVNSMSGLLGFLQSAHTYPDISMILALAVAAAIGGTTGSYFGSRKFPHTTIKRLLAVVLTIAGLKLVLT